MSLLQSMRAREKGHDYSFFIESNCWPSTLKIVSQVRPRKPIVTGVMLLVHIAAASPRLTVGASPSKAGKGIGWMARVFRRSSAKDRLRIRGRRHAEVVFPRQACWVAPWTEITKTRAYCTGGTRPTRNSSLRGDSRTPSPRMPNRLNGGLWRIYHDLGRRLRTLAYSRGSSATMAILDMLLNRTNGRAHGDGRRPEESRMVALRLPHSCVRGDMVGGVLMHVSLALCRIPSASRGSSEPDIFSTWCLLRKAVARNHFGN